jgi:hypothetical protein
MMTSGQQRSLLELQRLCAAQPNDIEMIGEPAVYGGRLVVEVSIRMGSIETRNGGLEFREREEFILFVPADFPFHRPSLSVAHDRFAGFPHVVWSHGICLYRQPADWNPRGGLYGFFEKLRLWLAKAAINDMDPLDVPLEPPHHVTDFSQAPFIIRADAPVAAGEQWIGFAQAVKHANRVELVGWTNLGEDWTAGTIPALAVVLPKALPLEFPKKGEDFFRELAKQDIDREAVLRYLAYAALLTDPGDEIHIVLGIPMRRSANGDLRLHVAVWTTSQMFAQALRITLQKQEDPPTLAECRAELAELIYKDIVDDQIVFCRIFDDRPEIVVARDQGTAAAWFSGKRVLLLGCGALGSWIGEIVARAGAAELHLVDNGLVKPGILARQNFTLNDVGSNKAEALAAHLRSVSARTVVAGAASDAHAFVMEDRARFHDFDLVIDCTASAIFQMKLERDWRRLAGATPPLISIGIDGEAKRCIGVSVARASTGGIWDAYLQLQHRVCVANTNRTIIDAFYAERARDRLFQPEPGCSEPTFVGSTADVMTLTATALNLLVGRLASNLPFGVAFATPAGSSEQIAVDVMELAQLRDVEAGHYRIRTTENVYREARAWVQQNNRVRSAKHETGGILWGLWDDAAEIIWVFDASGPPSDSVHAPERFTCGVMGTAEEHASREKQTCGISGFVGMWHTHPKMESHQSGVDVGGMAALVSRIGHNQRRALMLIFGHTASGSTATFYVYESHGAESERTDLVSVASGEHPLETPVV